MDFDAERGIRWVTEHVVSPPPTFLVRCYCPTTGKTYQRTFVLDDGLLRSSPQYAERLDAHKELIRKAIRKDEAGLEED